MRVVVGRFLLHTHVELLVHHPDEFRHHCDLADEMLCIRGRNTIAKRTWKSTYKSISYNKGLQFASILKCCYCSTDFRLSFQRFADEIPKIVIDKWQDFGTGCSDSEFVNQIYSSDPCTKLEDSVLPDRDLETEYCYDMKSKLASRRVLSG